MPELVLTLHIFGFNLEYYKQVRDQAMGTRLGPNYACLFVRYVTWRMLRVLPLVLTGVNSLSSICRFLSQLEYIWS